MSDFNSPKDLLRAYKEGFIGSICDPDDVDKLLGELPHPLFGAAAHDLYEGGKGKVALLYKNVQRFDPGFGPSERQTTGDCQNGSDLVTMADGSLKQIKNIKIGDYVISAFGEKRKVTNTFKKPYNKKMVELTLANHTKVASTPDHKYIVDNITMKTKPIGLLEIGDKVFMPQVNVEEEKVFDMSDFFTNVIDENTDCKKLRLESVESGYVRAKNSRCPIKRHIKLDEKLCWLLGLYAAEGGVDGVNGKQERITFNLGGHESVIAEQVRSYIKEIFDIDAHVYSVPSKPTVIYVRVNSVFVANLFKYLIHGNTYTKCFNKELFVTNKTNKLALLKGWIDGDGHLGNPSRVSATSVSKNLVLDFAKIANDVNLSFSIGKQDMSHDDTRQDSYHLRFSSASSRHIVCEKTKYVTEISSKQTIGCMIKIVDIKIVEPEEQFVYCIEVEKDHNFICNGIGINNCVSHSTRNAIDITRSTEIIGGDREEFIARSATEAIYGSRGHGGQGMSCSGAARFVHQSGGILLRQDYGFINLSKYNGSLGAGWGRRGVPSDVVNEAKKHQVKTISLIKSIEEARDAIANGYAISVCSGSGFSSRRDQYGIAKRSGGWSHAMCWCATDDSHEIYNETLFLVQNSWGVWNGGPKRLDQPDGSFWIRERDAAEMLSQNGSWVLSDVDGFPPRKVDWTLDKVF